MELSFDFVVPYAQKYIALVGIIPTSIGLTPLKNPPIPSSRNIRLHMVSADDPFPPIRLDCNCVFITSRGAVTEELRVPANPPCERI